MGTWVCSRHGAFPNSCPFCAMERRANIKPDPPRPRTKAENIARKKRRAKDAARTKWMRSKGYM